MLKKFFFKPNLLIGICKNLSNAKLNEMAIR